MDKSHIRKEITVIVTYFSFCDLDNYIHTRFSHSGKFKGIEENIENSNLTHKRNIYKTKEMLNRVRFQIFSKRFSHLLLKKILRLKNSFNTFSLLL